MCECPWLQRAQDHITSLINEYASCVHVTGLGQLPTITAICETLATATERAGAKIGSKRPPRINIASRDGRPESTTRFESAGANDPNRQSDSSRATRIGKAIRAGRHESTKRFGSAGPHRREIRVGWPEFTKDSLRPTRTEGAHPAFATRPSNATPTANGTRDPDLFPAVGPRSYRSAWLGPCP